MTDYKCLLYEVKDAIATLTLNRPERLNALGGTLRDDLYAAVLRASQDADVRVIVMTGAGKGFCAGGDVKAMNEVKEGRAERPLIDKVAPLRDRVLIAMRDAPQPARETRAVPQPGRRSPRRARVRDVRPEHRVRDGGRARGNPGVRREAPGDVQRALTGSGHGRDEVDLDQGARNQQARRAHGGARRRRGEEFLPHLVEAGEVRKIRVEHLRLDHVVQRRAGRFERLRQIFEHVPRLTLDVRAVVRKGRIPARLSRHARLEVTGELARGKDEIADHDSL